MKKTALALSLVLIGLLAWVLILTSPAKAQEPLNLTIKPDGSVPLVNPITNFEISEFSNFIPSPTPFLLSPTPEDRTISPFLWVSILVVLPVVVSIVAIIRSRKFPKKVIDNQT